MQPRPQPPTEAELAGVPTSPVQVPAGLGRAFRAEVLRPVWRNGLGGLTFRVADGPYVKWMPRAYAHLLDAEVARLRWAATYVRVPVVLDTGADSEGSWLVTVALPGESAVAPTWKRRPAEAARAVGRGLRLLHDGLPVVGCPFEWSLDARLARASDLGGLEAPPAPDRLVVCHGDPCVPNTLLGPDGSFTGHVDLAAMGVADRWADLAVATWSLEWNYGAGFERDLLDAYGVAPDPERTHYYRLLWSRT